ncbi:hypothetical protein BVY01_01180, partial [bacterium I07]
IEDGYSQYYRASRDRTARSSYYHFLKNEGYDPDEKNVFGRSYVSNLPFNHSKPKFLEKKSIEFLENHQHEPFMLYVNFLEPHSPYNGPFNDVHAPSSIILPENVNDSLDGDDPLRYRLLQAQHARPEREWQELLSKYYGLVTEVDICVGKILNKLSDLGLADNTIVVFTSDHGDMMGAHNMLAKTVMYEESVRVPFLIRYPDRIKHQIVTNRVSQIDIVPTLLDLLGYSIPEPLQGKSLTETAASLSGTAEPIFIEWNPNRLRPLASQVPDSMENVSAEERKKVYNASIRTVISPDGWKLNLCDHDRSQLFHLKKDPLELVNLFYDSRYGQDVRRLTELIYAWQNRTSDPLIL